MQHFLVHLVFHPTCEQSRLLAESMAEGINVDRSIFNSGIPSLILPETADQQPPQHYALNESTRCAVVVFTSDKMVLDERWAKFVGDLWAHCADDENKRFLPVQLSENAWPVDDRLNGTSFYRAFALPDEKRNEGVLRWLIIELCRILQGIDRSEKLPLTIFLSHAKQDLQSEPKIFAEISEHLNNTQPVGAWVDSAKIETGSQFAEEIEKGVSESVLMVLGTRNYGSRPWCRRELLMAKEYNRPFVVIDALQGEESRSFPYDGNAPRMRWTSGSAEKAVNLLLRETLRHYYLSQALPTADAETDLVLASPPELATVVALQPDTRILYPDPPLGDEEMERLAVLKLQLETPLQRIGKTKQLAGRQIALSISESSDCRRYGMTESQMDSMLNDVSLQLLVNGATLVYGGRIGSDGYTLALFDMVRSYSGNSGLPPVERVRNYVGWPLPNPEAVRAKYINEATIVPVPRPDELADLESQGIPADVVEFIQVTNGITRFAWAEGMTKMRQTQATTPEISLRIAIGGKYGPLDDQDPEEASHWYLGRIPGVIEEIYLSLLHRQPVLLIGAFGGGTSIVADLLEGRTRTEFSWDYQQHAPHAPEMRKIYDQRGVHWHGYRELGKFFQTMGVDGLSALNRLTPDENRELFVTRDASRILELILLSVKRIADEC